MRSPNAKLHAFSTMFVVFAGGILVAVFVFKYSHDRAREPGSTHEFARSPILSPSDHPAHKRSEPILSEQPEAGLSVSSFVPVDSPTELQNPDLDAMSVDGIPHVLNEESTPASSALEETLNEIRDSTGVFLIEGCATQLEVNAQPNPYSPTPRLENYDRTLQTFLTRFNQAAQTTFDLRQVPQAEAEAWKVAILENKRPGVGFVRGFWSDLVLLEEPMHEVRNAWIRIVADLIGLQDGLSSMKGYIPKRNRRLKQTFKLSLHRLVEPDKLTQEMVRRTGTSP